MTNKRYIVYPYGALSWDEIFETVTLLKQEGAKPEIVKHNGYWNIRRTRRGTMKAEEELKRFVCLECLFVGTVAIDKVMKEDGLKTDLWENWRVLHEDEMDR